MLSKPIQNYSIQTKNHKYVFDPLDIRGGHKTCTRDLAILEKIERSVTLFVMSGPLFFPFLLYVPFLSRCPLSATQGPKYQRPHLLAKRTWPLIAPMGISFRIARTGTLLIRRDGITELFVKHSTPIYEMRGILGKGV